MRRRPPCIRSTFVGLSLAAMLLAPSAASADYGLDAPTAVGPFLNGVFPSEVPVDPTASDWTVVPAYPNLSFDSALVITPPPAATPASNAAVGRLFVAQRDGLIRSFDATDPQVSEQALFADLRDRVAFVWDGGFLGTAFHPDFGQPGSPYADLVYVYYSTYCRADATGLANDPNACTPTYPQASTGGFFNTYLRLSRLHVDLEADPPTADPAGEEILFQVRLYNGSHRGGGLLFGDDGLLYLSVGDQFRYETAQDLANVFEGGVLRIDVDVSDDGQGGHVCDEPTSHLPIRTMEGVSTHGDEHSGQLYCIPDDNPFLAPGGERFEEFATLGNRAPHRMTKDRATGRIWSGEIGGGQREEINIIEPGRNYGWPFREGFIHGPRDDPPSYLGVLTEPVVDYARSDARAIIGGYVYRGSAFPELAGRYLSGDYIYNHIWALTYDPVDGNATQDLLTDFPDGLITWGETADGEILMGRQGNGFPLYTLARTGDPPPDPPALLSQTGAFSDLATLTPAAGLVPYAVASPLWSDAALKQRWIALPNDGTHDTPAEQIDFSESGDWSFPTGTVLVKHFELALDVTDPGLRRRLETRFLVHGSDGWYGVTYRWRPDGSDADLLPGSATDTIVVATESGSEERTWTYPSRSDCLLCHTEKSGRVLGPRTHQLNSDGHYPSTGRTANQLATWNHLGMLSPALDEGAIGGYPAAARVDDPTRPLADRARSYLDANCSHCHRPRESATRNRAVFDARFTTPLGSQELIDGVVNDDLGIEGARVIVPEDVERSILHLRLASNGSIAMPPLGRDVVDDAAVETIEAWIRSGPPGTQGNQAPVLTDPGALSHGERDLVSVPFTASDGDGDTLWWTAEGLPPGLTLNPTTGRVSGRPDDESAGDYSVLIGVSDGPSVDWIATTWTIEPRGPSCSSGSGDPTALASLLVGLAMIRTRRRGRSDPA